MPPVFEFGDCIIDAARAGENCGCAAFNTRDFSRVSASGKLPFPDCRAERRNFSICQPRPRAQTARPFSSKRTMNKPKILVADPVSERGVAELQEGGLLEVTVKTGLKEDELLKIIGEFDGLVVRSQTKVNARVIEAAKQLKV